MTNNEIGENIRYFRNKRGMTQQELADKLDITWEMISRYERGASSALNRVNPLAQALNVSVTQLLQQYNIPNNLNESQQVNRIPYHTSIPSNLDFKRSSKHYYTAPDWVVAQDPESFIIDSEIFKSKIVEIRQKDPIYVSPNSKTTGNSIVAYISKGTKSIEIDNEKNLPKNSVTIGVVIAQENRIE